MKGMGVTVDLEKFNGSGKNGEVELTRGNQQVPGQFIGKRLAVVRFSANAFMMFLRGGFGAVEVLHGNIPADGELVGFNFNKELKCLEFLCESKEFEPVVGKQFPVLPTLVFRNVKGEKARGRNGFA